MNKLYNKNGCTNIRYIGTISGTQGMNWVGAIQIGDKIYVGQGSSVYHQYHPYDKTKFTVDWQKHIKINKEQYDELNKQRDKSNE